MKRSSGALLVLLVAASLGLGCRKKASTDAAPVESAKPQPSATVQASGWPGGLLAKLGKGWFDVTTGGSGQAAPLSGKQCALWTLFYEGHEKDSNITRIFSDEWPKEGVTLTVDGMPIVVGTLHVLWETPPSMTKDYLPEDQGSPAKVKEMLTAKTWMDKPSDTLPTKVVGTERCLAPTTKYRAELRKNVTITEDGKQYGNMFGGGDKAGETVSYDLAIAPAP